MKKLALSVLVFISLSQISFAQWIASGSNIYYNSGNVTVGTSSANPGYKFYVNNANTFGFGIAGNNSSFVGAEIAITRTNSSSNIAQSPGIQFTDAATNYSTMIQSYQGQLQFFTFYTNGWSECMRINNLGNLLIGQPSQTNPTYKLDVAGSARFNSVVVNTTGADFVFEPTYKLPTLSFVENYINQNHHLPEIPSAKQMQADGLNVGDNQIKLLQKVEELTLYLIEKDKKEKEQDATIKKLEAARQTQEERIKNLEEKLNKLVEHSN